MKFEIWILKGKKYYKDSLVNYILFTNWSEGRWVGKMKGTKEELWWHLWTDGLSGGSDSRAGHSL